MQEEVRDAILALAERRGGKLTPSEVVEEAKSPSSPLHKEFDWSDADAARKWRLTQARHLIRNVHILVSEHSFQMVAPAFIRDPSVGGQQQGYASILRIRSDVELAREAVSAELDRVAAALSRAEAIAAVLGLSDEISNMRETVTSIRELVDA